MIGVHSPISSTSIWGAPGIPSTVWPGIDSKTRQAIYSYLLLKTALLSQFIITNSDQKATVINLTTNTLDWPHKWGKHELLLLNVLGPGQICYISFTLYYIRFFSHLKVLSGFLHPSIRTDILSNTQFVSPEDLAFQRGGILGSMGEGGQDISHITTLLRLLH